jgi:hypothetical protein
MIWWIILIGLVAMATKANWGSLSSTVSNTASTATGAIAHLIGFDPSRLSNPGTDEEQQIIQVSAQYGVDPRLISAIRMQENGGPGREYGVLGIGANSLSAQLRGAAQTIKNFLSAYISDTGLSPQSDNGRYTTDFISYVANGGPSHGGWAPVGASNDPTNLNQYWLANVSDNYYSTELA